MRRDLFWCALALSAAVASYLQFDPASPFAIAHDDKDPSIRTSDLHRQRAVEEWTYVLEHENPPPDVRAEFESMRSEIQAEIGQ